MLLERFRMQTEMMEAPDEPTKADASSEDMPILEFSGTIDPVVDIPNEAEILIYSKDQSYLTHGIHRFPAKFFPELPRYLIEKYSDSRQVVLDPMCGSGTVALEAMLMERLAVGIDIDPIAQLITRVKTTPIDPEILMLASTWLIETIQERYLTAGYEPDIPRFNYQDNWFHSFVIKELAIIRSTISDLPNSPLGNAISSEEQVDITNFFKIIFSSIIRDVSNADPHCTRTVIRQNLQRSILPGNTIGRFRENLEKQIDSMIEFAKVCSQLQFKEVRLPQSRAEDTGLDSDSIALAVTSPPYINAVDYPRTHQLEMYWLGLAGDEPLSKMKREYIGTETVYKKEYRSLRVSGLSALDPLLEAIFDKDPRRSFIVFKFFCDMKMQLQEMIRVLRPGARYCLAIGNNVIRGVPIPSQEVLGELATSDEVGFELEKIFFSGLIRHFIKIPRKERMRGEWVLILRKPQ
ncbi:MAG: hypothetical protein EAX81_05655 [Candidatus Thorarchaeota archaeon]|nr:hypothetical protein [Candidatus Thorarchaeota archaeon]